MAGAQSSSSEPTDDRRLVAAVCTAVADQRGALEPAVRAALDRLAPLIDGERAERIVRATIARLDGLGALDRLVNDPTVDEVLVNAGGEVWVERYGALQRSGTIAGDELAVVIERILSPLGRRLDRSTPIVDARLADGTRVCAVLAPISLDGTTLSLRRFRAEPLPLSAFLDERGDGHEALLDEVLRRRLNIVVSGATSSGKTSLLGSLLTLVDGGERIITMEDTAELAPPRGNLVRLEARPASIDGTVAIPLERLLHTALRLRPDRLVVGEVRGAEVLGLVNALNTGHDGSLSTVHANSPLDALHRLETLVVQAAPSWPLAAIRSHLSRCLDVVIHVERAPGGHRRISAIAEVAGPVDGNDALDVRPVTSPTDLRRRRSAPTR